MSRYKQYRSLTGFAVEKTSDGYYNRSCAISASYSHS